jgi:hypothetical protein
MSNSLIAERKKIDQIFKDMTKLMLVNCILQFFFIRLTRCYKTELVGNDPLFSVATIKRYYAIMYWVFPFTGWKNEYIYIGKKKFLKITKPVAAK